MRGRNDIVSRTFRACLRDHKMYTCKVLGYDSLGRFGALVSRTDFCSKIMTRSVVRTCINIRHTRHKQTTPFRRGPRMLFLSHYRVLLSSNVDRDFGRIDDTVW